MRPFFSAHPASETIIAAAALLSPGALPAVIVPSLRKAGRSLARLSIVVSGRLCSSFSKSPGLFRSQSSTGTISSANLPAACAAAKRFCERSAQRSWSSRVIWRDLTRSSVCQPECWSEKASFSPSRSTLS